MSGRTANTMASNSMKSVTAGRKHKGKANAEKSVFWVRPHSPLDYNFHPPHNLNNILKMIYQQYSTSESDD